MIAFIEVVYNQTLYGLQRIINWMLSKVTLKSMASADFIISISNDARAVIEKKFLLKKAVTIHHGIPALIVSQHSLLLDFPKIVSRTWIEIYSLFKRNQVNV